MRLGTVSEIQSGPPQPIKSGLPCANSEWVSQRIPSTYYPRRCHLLSNAALVAKATSSFFIIRYCLTAAGLGEISSPTAVVGLDVLPVWSLLQSAPSQISVAGRSASANSPFVPLRPTCATSFCWALMTGEGTNGRWGKPQWRSPNQTRQAALECAWDGDTIMVHSMATDVAPRAPTHTSDVPVSRELAAILQLRACRSTAERP